MDREETPWRQLREAANLSQREAERRMGWAVENKGHGRLSLIERGLTPTSEEVEAMRRLYAAVLLS